MPESHPPRRSVSWPSSRSLLALLVLAAVSLVAAGTLGATAAGYTDRVHARSAAIGAEPTPVPRGGFQHTRTLTTGMGLGHDGFVRFWGSTLDGLAGGTAPGILIPVSTYPGQPVMRQVAAGESGANAIDATGHVWGWGTPSTDGTDAPGATGPEPYSEERARRIRIGSAWNGSGPLLSGILEISTTANAGAGVRSDGTVWHWGTGTGGGGNAGAGASQLIGLPDPALPGNRPVHVKGGMTNFFVMLENGEVYTWGGQLRSGTNSLPAGMGDVGAVPTRIASLSPWARHNVAQGQPYIVAVDGGLGLGGALLSDGQVLTWGSSANRIGGRSTTPVAANLPAPAPALTGIRSFQYGRDGALLLRQDGELWGYGASGGRLFLPSNPARIDTGVLQYGVSQESAIWERGDGTVEGKGANEIGQLGLPLGDVTTMRRVFLDLESLSVR